MLSADRAYRVPRCGLYFMTRRSEGRAHAAQLHTWLHPPTRDATGTGRGLEGGCSKIGSTAETERWGGLQRIWPASIEGKEGGCRRLHVQPGVQPACNRTRRGGLTGDSVLPDR